MAHDPTSVSTVCRMPLFVLLVPGRLDDPQASFVEGHLQ
jgi:hypothetical protein